MQVTFLTTPFAATAVPIRPDYLIVLTVPKDTDQETIRRAAENLKAAINANYGPEYRFQIILGFEGLDIRSLDEEMMNNFGWVRTTPS